MALASTMLVHGLILAFHADWLFGIELISPGVFAVRMLEQNLIIDTIAWPTTKQQALWHFQIIIIILTILR